MLMEKERIEIVEYGKKMSESGLCRGTSGNISIYDPETGYMAISPSGIGYFETEPEDNLCCFKPALKGSALCDRRRRGSRDSMCAL